MSIIKEYKQFFLRNVQSNSGAYPDKETGFPLQYNIIGKGNVFNRLLQGNYPNESVFRKLLESITFKLNVEDTANTTEQGLSRLATDAEAEARIDNGVGLFENVIKPHHLPNVVLSTDGNDAVVGTPIELGGLKLSILRRTISGKFWKNFKLEINPAKSIIIEGTTKKLELLNDTATPGNDMIYGTSNTGVKGWRSFSIYIANIVNGLIPAYTFTKSVKLNILNIELDGDVVTPGNDKVYRTDGAGIKGWGTFPSVSSYIETIISYITIPGLSTRYLELNNQSLAELGFFRKYPIINTATLIGYCATPSSPINFKLNDKDGTLLEAIAGTSGTDASGMFRITLPIPNTHDGVDCSFEINTTTAVLIRFYGIELSKV